jgi:hypothetical protein
MMVVGKKVVCNSRGSGSIFSQKNFVFFHPLGLHFVRFLKRNNFGYIALHSTVDRLNFLAWYVYVNTTTKSLTCLA